MDRNPRFANGLWLGPATVLALLFWAFVGTSCAYGKTIREDSGGDLRAYILAANLAVLRGDSVQIRGRCASACTVYLVAACIAPRARLQFHAATDRATGRIDADGTARMAAHYPPALRKWFMANAAHLAGADYVELTGAQVIALGAIACD